MTQDGGLYVSSPRTKKAREELTQLLLSVIDAAPAGSPPTTEQLASAAKLTRVETYARLARLKREGLLCSKQERVIAPFQQGAFGSNRVVVCRWRRA